MSILSFVPANPAEAMHSGQPVYFLKPTGEYLSDLVAYERRRKEIQLNDFSPVLITRQFSLFQAADYDLGLLEHISQSPVSALLTILLHVKKRLEPPKSISNPVGYLCKDLAGNTGMILGICEDGQVIVSLVEKSSVLVQLAHSRDFVMTFSCFFAKQQIQQISSQQISHRIPVTLDMDVVRSFKTVPDYLNSESLNQLTKSAFRDYNEMRIMLEQSLTTLIIRLQELKRLYITKLNFCRVPCRWPFQFGERIQRFLNIGNNSRDTGKLPYEVLTLAQATAKGFRPPVELVNVPLVKRQPRKSLVVLEMEQEPQFEEVDPVLAAQQRQQREAYARLVESIQRQVDEYKNIDAMLQTIGRPGR